VSIRDLLAWVEFICCTTNDSEREVVSESLVTHSVKRLDLSAAYVHGACIVFVDALVTSGHLVLLSCVLLLVTFWITFCSQSHCLQQSSSGVQC